MGIIKGKLKKEQVSSKKVVQSAKSAFDFSTPILKGISSKLEKTIILDKIKIVPHEQEELAKTKFTPTQEIEAPLISPELISSEDLSPKESPIEEESLKELKEQHEKEVKKAYDEGYQAGVQDAQKKVGEQAQEIFSVIDEAVTEKNRILENAKEEVLNLAIQVAEKIIQTEVQTNETGLINIVNEALNKISDADKVIIKANKNDIQPLKANIPLFESAIPGIKNILVQEDPTVDQGGVILETDLGYIDATLKTKLDFIKNAIFDDYKGE